MNAVILAAGTGSRLVSATRYLPKALVEIRGRPLIDYTLDFVHNLGCRKISVAGGFYFDKLQLHIEKLDKKIQLFENSDFLKGNALSLLAALPAQEESFLLLNVDHIYPKRLGQAFLKKQSRLAQITAFVDFDRPLGDDDMKVLLDKEQKIEKISKNLHDFHAGYIGMTYIPQKNLHAYKSAVKMIAGQDNQAVVENVLQWFVENHQPPGIFDASGIRWLEIDNQNDLRNAERILSHVRNFLD
jgi:choline kinase